MTVKKDPPGPSIKLLLRPREAAAALAISPRKLWSLTKSGEIQAVRVGRAVRYQIEELRAWISRRSGIALGLEHYQVERTDD
jgi:excisionase family DNA binding protein